MIRYLRGVIIDKVRNQVVLDVHGVGYTLFVTAPAVTQAVIGEEDIIFHISESIREDAFDLFGFKSADERDLFEQLRKVPGVGPKVALGICGFYSLSDLSAIIQ